MSTSVPCTPGLDCASFTVPAQMLLNVLNILMTNQCPMSKKDQFPTDYAPSLKDGDVFDFIIAGGGSAGSVLTNRLSENKDWKILLLEAGDYPSGLSEIPAAFILLQNTKEDWAFRTEKGNHCLGFRNQTCSWPQGKALGGGSTINAMMYVYGNKNDYDFWVAEGAGEGWNWENMQKYYNKLNAYINSDGYMYSSAQIFEEPARDAIFGAARELGVEVNPGPGVDNRYGDCNSSIYNGERFSTAKGYLIPAKKRTNVFLSVNTHVTKIIIEDKKATGVQVSMKGKTLTVYANNEVIVSAGAVNSPKLLMLSGIGPRENLESVGIDVIEELPVGRNLQDHLMAVGVCVKLPFNFKVDPGTVMKYCKKRRGLLGTIGMTSAAGFINTKKDSPYPNVQFSHVYMGKDDAILGKLMEAIGYNDVSAEHLHNTNKEGDMVMMLATLLHPKSRGRIELRSKNYKDKPMIYAGYLDEEDDVKVLLESVDWINQMLKTAPMKGSKMLNLQIPNCIDLQFNTEEYWRCNLRNLGTTMFHPAGSNKMSNDSTAVIDPRLKVRGIESLRVIDSSVMPGMPSGNINLPTVALAEKGADLIKEDWNWESA